MVPNTKRYITNGSIPSLLMNFRKIWIVMSELTAEQKTVIIKFFKTTSLSYWIKFDASYKAANDIIGTDIKKENFTAVWRLNPSKRPVVIVTPEREVPGIRASICDNPIINASFLVITFIVLYCFPIKSDNQSKIPKKMVADAIINGSRK